ncbi:TPA: acyltransferase [Enterobacter kobei]|nr:acyltransferase [Enterobacter kobei]
MNDKKFRKDINGLRAIAVLSVVLFHFSSSYLPGGFAGVDVFFVISGFLMTSIILRGLSDGTFNLYIFLKARAVRIIPALLFVVAMLLFVGFLFFGPVIYQAIGKHSFGSLLFYSNVMYRDEAGYFDVASKGKFLLHTWSLSVEWQFYILYPIALAIFGKYFSLKNIKRIIILGFALSFLISVAITIYRPTSAYFMIYSRAWEMMLGGLAFAYPLHLSDRKKRYCEALGLAIIICSIIFMSEDISWPGYMAVVPVFGAYLCIIANNEKSILSNITFQKIGLWSYSIYLMHWPVLVFIQKARIDLNLALYAIAVLALSVISYELIEKKRNYGKGLVVSFVMVCIASYLVSIDGAAFRVTNSDYKLTLEQFRAKYEGHSGLPATEDVIYINGNANNFDYILVGDSHARHMFAYLLESDLKVASWATDSCKSTKHFFSKIAYSFKLEQRCKNRYAKVVEFINQHPGKKVVWMAAWRDGFIGKQRMTGEYPNNIIAELPYFISDIKGSKSDVYIIGDTQGSNMVMYECLSNSSALLGYYFSGCQTKQKYHLSETENGLRSLAEKTRDFKYISAADALCNDGMCDIIRDGMPVYTDTQHLTKKSSMIVGGYIFSKIRD